MGNKNNFFSNWGRKKERLPAQQELTVTVAGASCITLDDILLKQTTPEYRIGFWKNGTNCWQGSNIVHTDNWQILGCYDMNGDGNADIVATGCTAGNGTGNVILYIGYYKNEIDNAENWVTLGNFMTPADANWQTVIGNLTGKKNSNSIVWHSAKNSKLGVWLDNSTQWTEISGCFGELWEIIGCGNFDGTSKEAVLMSYDHGAVYYAVDLAGNLKKIKGMGSEWKVCGIGDLDGNGKDDILFVHEKLGLLAKWHMESPVQLGQIDSSDWEVIGCGRYSGKQAEDVLVRNKSNGLTGYYISGDLSRWHEIGKLEKDWTIIL